MEHGFDEKTSNYITIFFSHQIIILEFFDWFVCVLFEPEPITGTVPGFELANDGWGKTSRRKLLSIIELDAIATWEYDFFMILETIVAEWIEKMVLKVSFNFFLPL